MFHKSIYISINVIMYKQNNFMTFLIMAYTLIDLYFFIEATIFF